MPGEQQHVKAEDGVNRAKRWLDATTRVRASWTIYDNTEAAGRLTYKWPGSATEYSYDLGGILLGAPYENHAFLAECKKYKNAADQPKHFDKFLAQSYVTLLSEPRLGDHFMWITWAPFRATQWSKISDLDRIVSAILDVPNNRTRIFGDVGREVAASLLDMTVLQNLAERVWMIVLSDRQESLVISADDRALVVARRVTGGQQ